MTKKDYIAIGNAIKEAKKSLLYATLDTGETKRTIDIVTEYLAIVFKKDNANFNKQRFFDFMDK